MWINKRFLAKNSISSLLLVQFILLFLPQSAWSNEVQIRYEVGFNSVFRLNSWTPVSVFLENKGPEANGDLSIRVRSGSELQENLGETVYSKPVLLPMFSSKRYVFNVFINSYSHPLIVEFNQQGKSPYRTSVNLRQHFTEHPLVVLVNTAMTRPLFEHSGINFVSTLAYHLPEKWDGYKSVEMLVVGVEVLRSLTDSQLKALQNWVKQGGMLVLSGNLNYGATRDERLQRFIQTEIFGIKTVSGLKGLKEFNDAEFLSHRAFVLLKTRPKNAIVLAKENDIPIIYERDLGFGKVVFLAFEYQQPSFMSWTGWQGFWGKIYQLRREQTSFAVRFSKSFLQTALMPENNANFPSLRKTTLLLGAYLFCLFIVFRFMKRHDSKGLTGLMFLIVTGCIFSISGIWFFKGYLGGKTPAWAGLGQVKLSRQDSTALIRQFKSVMAFHKGEYQMDLASNTQVIHLLDKGPGEAKGGLVLNKVRTDNLAVFPMKNWSYRYLQTDRLADLAIDGHAFFENDSLTITLNNHSSHRFHGCYLLFGNSLLELGDIEAQKRKTRLFSKTIIDQNRMIEGNQDDPVFSDKIIIDRPSFFPDLNRSLRKELLDSVRSRFELQNDTVILIGRMTPEKGWQRSQTDDLSENNFIWIFEWEIPLSFR